MRQAKRNDEGSLFSRREQGGIAIAAAQLWLSREQDADLTQANIDDDAPAPFGTFVALRMTMSHHSSSLVASYRRAAQFGTAVLIMASAATSVSCGEAAEKFSETSEDPEQGSRSSMGGDVGASGGGHVRPSNGGSVSTSSGGSAATETCSVDADCVLVHMTGAACYSVTCLPPSAVTVQQAKEDECLVPWQGESAPLPTENCWYQGSSEEDVVCADGCGVPSLCATAACAAGRCTVRSSASVEDCSAQDAPDCEELDRVRTATLAAARTCDETGSEDRCGSTVFDQCGCEQVVNSKEPALIQAAQDARDAWADSCGPPTNCGDCDIPPPTQPGCLSDGLAGGICGY